MPEPPTFRWERVGEEYVAEWPEVLTLRLTLNGEIQEIVAAPHAPQSAVEKVRRGVVAAFIRTLAGKFSLHASAVALGDSALVLLGPSGAGKSTLAATLCELHHAQLLADDVAGLDLVDGHWCAIPSESAVWLSAKTTGVPGIKTAMTLPAAHSPKTIVLAVLLSFADPLNGILIRPVRGADSAAALLSALMRFEPSPTLMKREIDLVESIAGQVPVFELIRPHDASLEAVVAALLNGTCTKCNLPVEEKSP